MRMLECANCHDNYIEVDETKNIDNTISIAHCILCGHDAIINP